MSDLIVWPHIVHFYAFKCFSGIRRLATNSKIDPSLTDYDFNRFELNIDAAAKNIEILYEE